MVDQHVAASADIVCADNTSLQAENLLSVQDC